MVARIGIYMVTVYLSIVWVLVASRPVMGYEPFLQEGYGEIRLGSPIDQVGGERSETSPPVELRVNLLRVDDINLDGQGESSSELPSADKTRLARLVGDAARFWDQVPSASIRVQVGGQERSSTYRNLRSTILVTLGSTPSGVGGVSWGAASSGQHLPLGILINIDYFRAVPDATILSTIVHEIGHSLSLHHSSCDRNLTQNIRFGFTDSIGAFMSYGRNSTQAVLHTDDIAGISHLYPALSAATGFGSVEGELVDAAGAAIFGGNVFAVDSNNRVVAARLSGMSQFQNLNELDGRFRLEGLLPGTYTIVAAPVDDPTYRIGSLPRLPFDSSHRLGFAPTILGQVVVRGGQTNDVGRLVEGEDRNQTLPTGHEWIYGPYPGASFYVAYLYDQKNSQWVVRGARVTEHRMHLDIEDGFYRAWVYARVNNSWKVVMWDILLTFGNVQAAPPIIQVPATIDVWAGDRFWTQFAVDDPQGSRVQVYMTGAPAGMRLFSRSLYWAQPVAGSYDIRILATNELNQQSTATIRLNVRAAETVVFDMNWSRQVNDVYYLSFLYSLDRGTYAHLAAQTENRLVVDVIKGRYVVGVLRIQRRPGYDRAQYQWVAHRRINLDSGTTLDLP
ncbi:MAG: hypothetical protein QF752_14085 [Planctomycetota bacterium]|jgi:hypothetical protein|nr:hypothetical protein [Planctomycetota bacterium]